MSNEIYHDNLAVLKDRFPEVYLQLLRGSDELPFNVEFFNTRWGQINAFATLADGRRIPFYDKDDITGSTEDLMTNWQLDTQDILFCAGMGLGYYPLVAAGKFSSQPQIVVIEPHIGIIELALRSVDLRPLLKYPRFSLFVGNDLNVPDIIDQYHFQIFLGKQRVVTHLPSRTIFGGHFITIENELKESIGLTRDLWNTNKDLGRDMLSNLMSNLPSLFNGAPLGQMKGAFAGCPALCVSAGPSLDEAVPLIWELQDKILIVALDSAVSTLIPAGIRPHIVATCDTRRINFEKLRPFLSHLRHSILVFALESNPDNVKAFLGPHRLAVASDNMFIKSWLWPALGIDCNLSAMSTVSHTAIYTMMALGADPIIVVGMDMAFPGDKSHAKNSVNKYNLSASRLIQARGTNGSEVRTYRPMVDYTRQLESVITKSRSRFVNTCLSGMFIRGMQVKSLKEVAETELAAAPDVNQLLGGLKWTSPVKDADIISALTSKRGELEIHQGQCSRGIREADGILECLHQVEAEPDLEDSLEKLNNFYKNLQNENANLIQLLSSIRLEKLKKIGIRRLKLHRNSIGAGDNEKTNEELRIIKDDLKSQQEAAAFFCGLIAGREDFYQRLCKLKDEIKVDPKNLSIQLQLANLYSEAGEIMLAENSYRRAMDCAPDDVKIRLDLMRMYVDWKLWGPARELIQETFYSFPDDPDVKAMQAKIENKISGIMDYAKAAWEKGDKVTSQRLLNEYLLLRVENVESNRIKDALEEHEAKIASDLPPLDQDLITGMQFEDLLAKAAGCIEKIEFEQAIGILEGLIERFPAKEAGLREKIGDCRLLQQDYQSALWNYTQALNRAPRASEIKSKIDDTRRKMKTLSAL